MRVLPALIAVFAIGLGGCKDDCPPCKEPKTFPINFGGDCIPKRNDPACPAYVPPSPADSTLYPNALCYNSFSGRELMGVWEQRPMMYGQWGGEIRTIRRHQAGFSTKESTLYLCPDLQPGKDEKRIAIDGPVRILVTSWGYTAELDRYYVTGTVEEEDTAQWLQQQRPRFEDLWQASTSRAGGMAAISLMEMKMASFAASASPMSLDKCKSDCDVAMGAPAHCMYVKGVPRQNVVGLDKLRLRLADGNNDAPLPTGELLGYFGLNSDPCNRGPTTFSGSTLTNAGATCYVDLLCKNFQDGACKDGPKLRDGSEQLWFMLPENVSAERSTTSGIQFTFPNASEAPTLEYESERITQRFGGPIRGVVARDDGLMIQTERGCIDIAY